MIKKIVLIVLLSILVIGCSDSYIDDGAKDGFVVVSIKEYTNNNTYVLRSVNAKDEGKTYDGVSIRGVDTVRIVQE